MEKTTPKTKKPVGAERTERYFEGLGRRKTATARVRIWPSAEGKSSLIVNGKKYQDFFTIERLQSAAFAPFTLLKLDMIAEAKTSGGGIMAQSEAVSLGIARALVKHTPSYKAVLAASGLLSRDSRAVERKKPGLRKARRAHQWKKR